MKKDLSNMLMKHRFSSLEELKDYLVDYVLEIILLELESLPKHEWERTFQTWKRILGFSYTMMGKPPEERERFYQRANFDGVMKTIVENLIEVFVGAIALGAIKRGDTPLKILDIALEHATKRKDTEMLEYIKKIVEDSNRS